jgi:hypothetical protein
MHSTAGEQLVAAIVAEMADVGAEPDARERALLVTAARLADRIDAAPRRGASTRPR